MQGRVTNTETLTQQINYAFVNRGLSYESEGTNRNVPVNFGTVAQRDAAAGPAGTTNYSTATASLPDGTANVLTGTGNHASADAPFGIQGGYIFNAVLKAGDDEEVDSDRRTTFSRAIAAELPRRARTKAQTPRTRIITTPGREA